MTTTRHALVGLGLMILGSAAAPALEVYDEFKGTRLKPQLWNTDWVSPGAYGVNRAVRGGRLNLYLRAYADTTSTGGRNYVTNTILFPDSVAANVDAVRVIGTIKKPKSLGCDQDTGTSTRVLLPRVGGYWFNDGNGADDDHTGDVWASIRIERGSALDLAANQVRVTAGVYHCSDDTCENGTSLFFDTLGKFRVTKSRARFMLHIEHDAANSQFVFRMNDRSKVFVPYDSALNQGPTQAEPYKGIELLAQVENCDPSILTQRRPEGRGDMTVNRVLVNEAAIP